MIQHLTAMWKFRHFLFALVKLDLRMRYRRSVIGVGWSLLNPIAMTIVFTVVFSNLLGGGDPIAYAASVLTGMPGLLLLLLAAWAATTLAAFVTVFFHDMQHMLEVAAQIVFFLTPIMYTRKLLDDKQLGWMVDANPVYWLLELTRTPLLTGQLPSLGMYAAGVAVTLALVGLAAGAVAWLHKRVIFQL
jgi:lipopolysaccharide transport system permease protein